MARSTLHDNRNSKTRGGPRGGDPGSEHGAVRMSVAIAGVLGAMAKGLAEQAAAEKISGRLAVVESAALAARDAASCYWYLITASGVDRAAYLCHSGLRHAETAEQRLTRLPAPASADNDATDGERWIALHAELDAPYLARASEQAQQLLEAAYPNPARREAATLALHAARDLLAHALTATTRDAVSPQQLSAGISRLEALRALLRSLGAVPTADRRNSAQTAPTGQTGTGE